MRFNTDYFYWNHFYEKYIRKHFKQFCYVLQYCVINSHRVKLDNLIRIFTFTVLFRYLIFLIILCKKNKQKLLT